jgi:hypothetical protein
MPQLRHLRVCVMSQLHVAGHPRIRILMRRAKISRCLDTVVARLLHLSLPEVLIESVDTLIWSARVDDTWRKRGHSGRRADPTDAGD